MKKVLTLLVLPTLLLAQFSNPSPMSSSAEPKLVIQNTILTKVNGTTISLLDVMKKMDLFLYKAYPEISATEGNSQVKVAKHQFYSSNWRHFLNEMVNTELMLADAKEKELEVTDGEVREEIEKRFAPNIMLNLDSLDLTYPEVWQMIKQELIVQKMSWYCIHSKALQSVTPQDIRASYQDYLEKNPLTTHWTYQLISIRGGDVEALVKELYASLQDKEELAFQAIINEFQKNHSDASISLSTDYTNNSQTASENHKSVLSNLEKGQISIPIIEKSRVDQKMVARIFYLKDLSTTSPAPFDVMANRLKNELLQKEAAKETELYITKLKERYGYNNETLLPYIAKDFEPFQLR